MLTDGSSLWFSTCPSGDSYDRIKRLDLSTGGITTLFDAGDTSGQSANIIGCTGRQLVVSVSPYYDSSEPTDFLPVSSRCRHRRGRTAAIPITNASAGRTTNISAAVLDDTLYEYDYTTGELTATGLADRQTRTVIDALPPDPYEGRGAFDVTITRILNGQLVVQVISMMIWVTTRPERPLPFESVRVWHASGKPLRLAATGRHTHIIILGRAAKTGLPVCRTEPYTRTTTGTDAYCTRFIFPTAILG